MAILTEDEVREALAGRPAWKRTGDSLVRERALKDWGQALAFLDRIGQAVDDWGRHPDIALTSGNRVRITVANPNGAGITDAELRLVQKVDEVADAPAEELGRPRGALAAVASTAAEVVEMPVELVTESRRRGAVVAAITAGGLALGVAAAAASRRR
jgi:4a-hydroxytetrahydrobiopterin dehydratase